MKIKEVIQERKVISDKIIKLDLYKGAIDSKKDQLKEFSNILSKLKETYISTLEKVKICPICKSPISSKIIKEIGSKL